MRGPRVLFPTAWPSCRPSLLKKDQSGSETSEKAGETRCASVLRSCVWGCRRLVLC